MLITLLVTLFLVVGIAVTVLLLAVLAVSSTKR